MYRGKYVPALIALTTVAAVSACGGVSSSAAQAPATPRFTNPAQVTFTAGTTVNFDVFAAGAAITESGKHGWPSIPDPAGR